jgi:hypothetical protein
MIWINLQGMFKSFLSFDSVSRLRRPHTQVVEPSASLAFGCRAFWRSRIAPVSIAADCLFTSGDCLLGIARSLKNYA